MRRTAPLVLVVDDDATATTVLTHWLYGQAFNGVAAASCLEARAVLEAVPAIEGIIGHLALPDGSLFHLAQRLRVHQPNAVVIGYADVDVCPPPELDACFVRPLDLEVLGMFLAVRFGRRRSGEHLRARMGMMTTGDASGSRHSIPPARLARLPKKRA